MCTLAIVPNVTLEVEVKFTTPLAVRFVVVTSPLACMTVTYGSFPTEMPLMELKGFSAI
jgi:hypothetical protein